MNLQLNGETKRFEEVATVAQLLDALDLDRRQVVVELNEKIVKRDEVDRAPVRENDTIEILRFVGGGVRFRDGGVRCAERTLRPDNPKVELRTSAEWKLAGAKRGPRAAPGSPPPPVDTYRRSPIE